MEIHTVATCTGCNSIFLLQVTRQLPPPAGRADLPLSLHHFWHSPLRDISAWLPTKKTTRPLSAGSDSWCLRTLKHFTDQGQSAPSQTTVSRADCLCTLNDTSGTFQQYWESEQEVSQFKNVSLVLREPAETREQCATKWANCKHQSIYKHW